MKKPCLPILAWILACAALSWSAPKDKPAPAPSANRVDSIMIHKLYMDGEFETAIAMLELNLKETPNLGHNDSVFIFKHLGVMYAAAYETREKGKYYMHQLLMTEPTAKIMDMYASDMIYMIFKNIQDEFMSKRARINPSDYADPEGKPEPRPGSGTSKRKIIWIGAAVLAVGVGVTILFLALPSGGGNTHEL